MAVVLGHEVAHAVAKHSNERMSQQMVSQYGSSALGIALGGASETVKTVAGTVYGLGAEYGVLLPYSRKQELEADKLGLVFMAMAGYDPREAASFWTRMAEQSGAASVAEFMSTHPSDDIRIQKIQEDLPAALEYYQGTGKSVPKTTKSSGKWSF